MSTTASPYGNPETRRRILEAAWQLLERGEGRITLAAVAEAADVSRQAVYLHFRDRSGLLVALVEHIDQSFGSTKLRAHISGAPSGVEGLRRWIETMSWYTAKIDVVTRVLEWGQHDDEAQAAAWRDRMGRRRDQIIRPIVERLAEEGALAEGWTLRAAVDIVYVTTMPGPWRELTAELGWTSKEYARHVTGLLLRGLLRSGQEPLDTASSQAYGS